MNTYESYETTHIPAARYTIDEIVNMWNQAGYFVDLMFFSGSMTFEVKDNDKGIALRRHTYLRLDEGESFRITEMLNQMHEELMEVKPTDLPRPAMLTYQPPVYTKPNGVDPLEQIAEEYIPDDGDPS